MRLHRFFIDTPLTPGTARVKDAQLVNQWKNVLRLRVGDKLIVCKDGREADAVIDALSSDEASLTVGQLRTVGAEPQNHVTLCAAILKRENFEWAVQKATEVGVKEIIPIISERTVKTGLKMDRLRMIAKEAAEQCGRGMIPVIHEPMEFEKAIETKREGTHIFFHISPDTLFAPIPSPNPSPSFVWIGPEGGWTDAEASLAKDVGMEISSLGPRALRAETAAVVAAYLACTGGACCTRALHATPLLTPNTQCRVDDDR